MKRFDSFCRSFALCVPILRSRLIKILKNFHIEPQCIQVNSFLSEHRVDLCVEIHRIVCKVKTQINATTDKAQTGTVIRLSSVANSVQHLSAHTDPNLPKSDFFLSLPRYLQLTICAFLFCFSSENWKLILL